MAKDWCIQLKHVLREANHCADWLANQACMDSLEVEVPLEPPADLSSLLYGDTVGVSFLRL
ncbi:conserved hypothetical protein [Ricinus communis]|uniref:RNase H type-1 domain-containing protein n=1 Tax=Ricinus communis TaxID=3988 RepID=B9R7C3_RICCO|nr:conserved hypothetical protein [Ricinus communis]